MALFALLGALVDYDRARVKIGTSPFTVSAYYLASSVVIGALTGVLEKQLRSRVAAMLFGFLIMIPTAAAGMLLIKGSDFTASTDGRLSILLIAALIGPLCANVIRGK